MTKRWFLVALAVVMGVGIGFAELLQPLGDQKWFRNSLVAIVLFFMALPVQASSIWGTIRRPVAPLTAMGVNLGLLPLLSWLVSGVMPNEKIAGGLLIAAVTPCTLASASVWTRKAGGNDSVSLMVTIGTNLSCFLISPLWLYFMLGDSANANIQLSAMIQKLGILVVLPMAFAQALRQIPAVGRFATARKKHLSILCQCGILGMVFIGSIKTGLRLTGAEPPALSDFIVMLTAVITIHTAMFWSGYGIGQSLKFARPDSIAVAFAGSQKTLMVGLQLAMDCEVSILPMITYHVTQLIIDTFFADYLKSKEPPGE